MRPFVPALLIAASLAAAPARAQGPAAASPAAAPLVVGETFTIASRALGETRRINVYLPYGYAESPAARFPVLYMPDGGVAEDFLHIAGLVQVGAGNGTMRPFILVGIENTQRRRDLTGPTQVADDRKIAPVVGGSAAFREFIRTELMPQVTARYRVTGERAIVGESLAGLFVLETFVVEPSLFDGYVAVDPSLWWNGGALLRDVERALATRSDATPKAVWIASAGTDGMARQAGELAAILARAASPSLRVHHVPMPDESHATIFHPAALRAFRTLFAPPPTPAR